MGYSRNGSDERPINIAPVVHETQKGANHTRQQACRLGRSKLACFVHDEIADLLSAQSPQVTSASWTGSREETMRGRGVNLTAGGSKAALAQQISREVLHQRVHLGLITGLKCLRRYESFAVHPCQQLPQCDRIATSAWPTISQESLTNAEREFRHRDALPVKPSTESHRKPCFAQENLVRVALLVQRSCIQLQDRTQRTFGLSKT